MSPGRVSSFPRAEHCQYTLGQNYLECGYIFLPDLATALDERETTDLLEIAGVAFVPRGENPPFVPQLCPIEDLWGILKQTYVGMAGGRT